MTIDEKSKSFSRNSGQLIGCSTRGLLPSLQERVKKRGRRLKTNSLEWEGKRWTTERNEKGKRETAAKPSNRLIYWWLMPNLVNGWNGWCFHRNPLKPGERNRDKDMKRRGRVLRLRRFSSCSISTFDFSLSLECHPDRFLVSTSLSLSNSRFWSLRWRKTVVYASFQSKTGKGMNKRLVMQRRLLRGDNWSEEKAWETTRKREVTERALSVSAMKLAHSSLTNI